ncbi:hypothetical protein B0H14DRAFT_2380596 [Mycena olivaceomarginata]|nr:hypothetical protein B0H14DRAFT_2380596 [Mycena olivaceomarginata]
MYAPFARLFVTHDLIHIYAGYRWLFERAQTMHRDISIGNLMFRIIDGRVCGVLNDFDLAVRLDQLRYSTSNRHTGTKPYMAIDLLFPEHPLHLYRHDLESLLYVFVFLTCEIEDSPLAHWEKLAIKTLSSEKQAAMTNGFPPFRPHFQQFCPWIAGLRALFREGTASRAEYVNDVRMAVATERPLPPLFNDITLGGSVTFATFKAVLDIPI